MTATSSLCFIFLSCLIPMQGWCAVTPLFVRTGSDVTLTVSDVPGDYLLFSWKFNRKTNLVTYIPGGTPTVSQNYTGRVEFSVKNYSVRLMSLQKADSGIYTGQVTGTEKTDEVEYSIRVEDPVSPVELTVDSVSSGSDSCNLSVSCRTQDAHINSTITCDSETCSQEEGERSVSTSSAASLTIHLLNDSILCNHSNQVSWTSNTTMLEPVCALDANKGTQWSSPTIIAIFMSFTIFFAIIIIAAVIYHRRRKRGRATVENTVYASPEVPAAPSDPTSTYSLVQAPVKQNQDEPSTNDGSDLSPASTYSEVGPPTRSTQTPETSTNKQPESLYAQVERPARP
ncbi:uncharacterized protein V6R79_018119 [Siganus canaliculatus]